MKWKMSPSTVNRAIIVQVAHRELMLVLLVTIVLQVQAHITLVLRVTIAPLIPARTALVLLATIVQQDPAPITHVRQDSSLPIVLSLAVQHVLVASIKIPTLKLHAKLVQRYTPFF
jgi:hypothetical protein